MRTLCALGLCLAIGVLGACGDAAPKKGPAGSPSNPLVALPNPAATRTPPTQKPLDEGAASEPTRTQARSASRPCTLVTKAQAEEILRTPILAPLTAPQGPTCIYQSASHRQYITLAVQTANIKALLKPLRRRKAIRIGRRTAVCGTLGRPILYLAVAKGRVLTIGAPCFTATAFAVRAAPHL